MLRQTRGFTLIELLVTAAVVAVLVLGAGPLATNWTYSAQTHSARTQLAEAYSLAKALALQNPNHVAVSAGAAAGMKISTDGTTTTVFVCVGSASSANCVANGSAVTWSTTYSGLVTTTINSVAATTSTPLTLNIDNRGEPATSTAFVLSRGGTTNNETGTLF